MKHSVRKIVEPPKPECKICKHSGGGSKECKGCTNKSNFAYGEEAMNEYIKNNCMTMTDQELADKLKVPKYTVYYRRRKVIIKNGPFEECNDDCFNCPYPDCLKPYSLCSALDVEDPASDRGDTYG